MNELDLKPTTQEASESEIPTTEDIEEHEADLPGLREYLIGLSLSLSLTAGLVGPELLKKHHVESDIEALKAVPALSHSDLTGSNFLLDQAFTDWVDIPVHEYLLQGTTKYEQMFNVQLILQCENVNISSN